MELIGVLM